MREHTKHDLLVRIEEALRMPGRAVGFNDRDDTIAKDALARILAGIERQQQRQQRLS